MTPKEKAMKWIKKQEFAFYTYATLEKILDIALKEQANNVVKDLEDIYNDLQFFDEATIYNPEKQSEEIQVKIRKLVVKIKYI